MKRLIILTLLVLTSVYAEKKTFTEKEKIEYLLTSVGKLDAFFIRNGSEHSSPDAVAHMRKKLDYAGSKIKTAEEFIDKIATKSSMTGEIYFIKFKGGKKIETAIWLREELKKIN